MTKNTQSTPPEITCLACSIFRQILPRISENLSPSLRVRFFDSMLHMDPEKMATLVFPAIAEEEKTSKVLILYGDCHPDMDTWETPGRIARVKGHNCAEIVLGSDLYHQLQKERTFFIFPEWADRWKEIFSSQFGFTDESLLSEFMKDFFTKIVFINTGATIPHQHLDEIAAATGMPVQVITPDLTNIREQIETALQVLQTDERK